MIIPPFPQRITLELTNRCNLQCTFCPRHSMGSYLGTLDTALAYRLIDEMAEHVPLTLVPFFRGESLLHPDWHSIIKYAHNKGVGPIQFTTNGTLLDAENAQKLLDCGVDFISFSLDTLDAAVYEQSRHGANYAKTLQNILYFLELHQETHSTMTVQVSAVETAAHRGGIDAFVQYWQPKVDRVRIYMEHSANGKPGSLDAPLQDVPERRPCKKVFEDMVILWDGAVAICNHDWQRQKDKAVFVDVRHNSIAKAWQCTDYNNLRTAHIKGTLDTVHPCDACEQWKTFYLPQQCIGQLFTRASKVVS